MKKLAILILFALTAYGDTPPPVYQFSAPLTKSGTTVGCRTASGTQSGCLSSADWSTFNGKQSALASPLELVNSYTSHWWGSPSSLLGVNSDLDTLNQSVLFGSTDSSLNSTSSATLITGDLLGTNLSVGASAGQISIQASNIVNDTSGNPVAGGTVGLGGGNSIAGLGGGIFSKAGNSTSGNGGDVQFQAGNSTTGTGGNVYFFSGQGGAANGVIQFQVPSGVPVATFSSSGNLTLNKSLSMSSQKITSLLNPTAAQDAATKSYVDGLIPSFADSLVNTSGTVTLVGDSASPGNSMYYGTNSSGVKGFYSVGTGSGTVTSVGLAAPSWLTVSGSPVTTSGTLTLTGTSESANLFLASPNGLAGAMTPRQIVSADLPTGNLTDTGTDGITVTGGTSSVIGSGTSLAQHVADSTHNGYLSSSDWSTFNGKQSSLTLGNLTDAGTDGITITGGTGAVVGSGTSLSQHVADTTHSGYLSSSDWNTFNGKQASGSYITALTGDVSASGPGSVAATLATVNSNVGSFTNASVTVNAKGLVTAASSGTTGNLTDTGTDGITVTGGTGAVLGSGASLSQHVADSTHNGYLSSSDWSTFNSKASTQSTGITLDGGGAVISTGLKGFVTVPYSGTVSEWAIICDQSGSIVIDVWKVTYAGFPGNSGNSITGTDPPTISSAQKNRNQSITAWTTTSISADDILEFNVNSATTVTRCNLVLKITH